MEFLKELERINIKPMFDWTFNPPQLVTDIRLYNFKPEEMSMLAGNMRICNFDNWEQFVLGAIASVTKMLLISETEEEIRMWQIELDQLNFEYCSRKNAGQLLRADSYSEEDSYDVCDEDKEDMYERCLCSEYEECGHCCVDSESVQDYLNSVRYVFESEGCTPHTDQECCTSCVVQGKTKYASWYYNFKFGGKWWTWDNQDNLYIGFYKNEHYEEWCIVTADGVEGQSRRKAIKKQTVKYKPSLWWGDLPLEKELRLFSKSYERDCCFEEEKVSDVELFDDMMLNDKRDTPYLYILIRLPVKNGKTDLSQMLLRFIEYFEDLYYIQAMEKTGVKTRQLILKSLAKFGRDGKASNVYALLQNWSDRKINIATPEVIQMWNWRYRLSELVCSTKRQTMCSKGLRRLMTEHVEGQFGIFATIMPAVMTGLSSLWSMVSSFGGTIVEAFAAVGGYFSGKFIEWFDWFGRIAQTLKWSPTVLKIAFRFIISLAVLATAYFAFKTWKTVKAVGRCTAQILWGVDPGNDTLDEEVMVLEAEGAKELAVGLSFLASMIVGEGISAKSLQMAFSLTNSSKPFISDLVEQSSYAIDYVYFKLTGERTWLYKTIAVRLLNFKKDIASWDELNPNWRTAMLTNTNLIDNIKEFHKEIDEIQKSALSSSNIAQPVMSVIMGLEREFKTRLDYVLSRNPDKGKRSRPTVIWLFGKPGQGKTTIAQALTYAIYNYVASLPNTFITEPYSDHQCWSRAKNTDYWEGYSNNFTHHVSEMFSHMDIKKRGEDATMYLDLVDNTPLPLNMAEAHNKGIFFYTSKLMIVTTNFEDFANTGLTDADAMLRRIHFPIEITKLKDLDMDEFASVQGLNEAWSLDRVCKFKKGQYNFVSSKDEHLTFEDLVVKAGDEIMRQHLKLSANKLASKIDWSAEAIARRAKTVPDFSIKVKKISTEEGITAKTLNLSLTAALGPPGNYTTTTTTVNDVDGQIWISIIVNCIVGCFMPAVCDVVSKQVTEYRQKRALKNAVENYECSYLISEEGVDVDTWTELLELEYLHDVIKCNKVTADYNIEKLLDLVSYINYPVAHRLATHMEQAGVFYEESKVRKQFVHMMYGAEIREKHNWSFLGDVDETYDVDYTCIRILYLASTEDRWRSKMTALSRGNDHLKTVLGAQDSSLFTKDPFVSRCAGLLAGIAVFASLTAVIWGVSQYCRDCEAESMSKEVAVKMKKQRHRDRKNKGDVTGHSGFSADKKQDAMRTACEFCKQIVVHGKFGRSLPTFGVVSGHCMFVTKHANMCVNGIETVDVTDSLGHVISQRFVINREVFPYDDKVRLDLDDRGVTAFPSINKRLRLRSDIPFDCPMYRVTTRVTTKGLNTITSNFAMPSTGCEFSSSSIQLNYTDLNDNRQKFEVKNYYRVINCAGRAGDCGRVYVAIVDSNKDIVGFHFGGMDQDSYCTPLYFEDLGIKGQCDVLHMDFVKMSPPIVDDYKGLPGVELYGSLAVPGFMPTETVFTESQLYSGMIKDDMVDVAPAHLTFFKNPEGKLIDPHANALAKLPLRTWPRCHEIMKIALENPQKAYKGFGLLRRNVRMLTIEEALFGIPGRIDPLNRKASVTKDFRGRKRTELWNPDTRFVHPELRAAVTRLLEMVDSGHDVLVHAEACFKDELRPWDRVEGGNTRRFDVVSLTACIVTKMLVGDLIGELKSHRGDVPSAVGINPFGFDWTEMYYRLNQMDGGLFGADCSGWDITILPWLSYIMGRYFCARYKVKPESPEGIRLMWCAKATVGGLFLYGRLVLRDYRGVKSGSWLTSFANTFFNHVIHNSLFRMYRPSHDYKFKECVSMFLYGDDNIGRVRKDIESWFNMETLRDGFRDYFGMKYTTPGKDEVVKPFLEWNEVTFLSRTFRPIIQEGSLVSVLAPLDQTSIYGMIAWLRRSKDVSLIESLQINVKMACMEMSLYGRAEYDHFTDMLLKWAIHGQVEIEIKDFSYWEDRMNDTYNTTESSMTENYDSEVGMEMVVAQSSISTPSNMPLFRETRVCDLPFVSLLEPQQIAESYLGDAKHHEEALRGLNDMELSEKKIRQGYPSTDMLQEQTQVSKTILEREFRILSHTATIGTSLFLSISPLTEFFNLAASVKRIIGLYRYIRWKSVRIRIVMKTLPQQYGFVNVVKTPYLAANSGMLKARDPIVLTLTDQETVEFDLPFIAANDWVDCLTANQIEKMWFMRFESNAVETDRVDSDVASTYTFDVYASLNGVELLGPRLFQVITEVEAQADHQLPLFDNGAIPGESFNIPGILSLGTLAASTIPMVKTVADWYSGEPESEGLQPTTGQTGITKSTHGDVSSMSHGGQGNNLDCGPPTFFLDPKRWGDTKFGHRIRDIIEHPQFESLFVLTAASSVQRFVIVPNNVFNLGAIFPTVSEGFMAYMSQFFRRWRGSLQVFLKFTTSAFISARVSVALCYGGVQPSTEYVGDLPSRVVTIKGNYEMVWEIPYIRSITWSTTHPGTLENIYEQPTLSIKLDAISGTGNRTPSVIGQYWIKPGPDFVFDSYQAAWQITNDPVPRVNKNEGKQKKRKVQAQCDVNKAFLQVEPMPGFKLSTPRKWDLTIEQLLSRWSDRYLTQLSFAYGRIFIPEVGKRNVNWDALNWLFLFNSGSTRHKLFTDSTTGIIQVFMESVSAGNEDEPAEIVDSASAATGVAQWPTLDFSVPYVAHMDVQMNPTCVAASFFDYQEWTAFSSSVTEDIVQQWIKASDNYQVYYLIPPPEQDLWPWINNVDPPMDAK